MATNILGVSAYYHDSAACLFRDDFGGLMKERKQFWPLPNIVC